MERKNNGLGIVLVVVIIVSLCFFFLNKDKKDNNISSNNEVLNNNETLKIDVSRAYVSDATYSYDNKYIEYRGGVTNSDVGLISYFGIDVEYSKGKQILTNLKVPYFNINSEDATDANNELFSLYTEYAKKFDVCAEEDKDSSLPSCTLLLTYKSYQYDNIASVVVIDSAQATSKWVLNYHTYNFDLTTGKNLSYDEVLNKLGYSRDSVSSIYSNLIKEKMDNIVKNFDLNKACSFSKDRYNTENCYDITYKLLDDSISDDSVLYFINNDGELNLLPVLYFDFVQDGTVNRYLITVSK